MALKLYMDVHIHRAITAGLRMRGIDVITAQEDQRERLDDERLLQRATELGRVLVSQDADLLRITALYQREQILFAGLVYGHLEKVTIGGGIEDLYLMAAVMEPDEMRSRVQHLPL